MNLLDGYVRFQVEPTDDGRAVQHLAIRVFNGFATSWKLMSSGYYQNSAMIQRDLLETIFLVNYFHEEPSRIAEWRTADRKTLKNTFGPASVRKALDEKAGMGRSKREQIYQRFCQLAAHPTLEGFQMLKPKGMDAHIGPFSDATALRALLEEAGKLAAQAGYAFLMFLNHENEAAQINGRNFLLQVLPWAAKYMNMPYSADDIAEIERIYGTKGQEPSPPPA